MTSRGARACISDLRWLRGLRHTQARLRINLQHRDLVSTHRGRRHRKVWRSTQGFLGSCEPRASAAVAATSPTNTPEPPTLGEPVVRQLQRQR